jgi:hypothetical protein
MSEETVPQNEITIYVNSESGIDREDIRGDSPETAFRTMQYAFAHMEGVMKSNSRTTVILDSKRVHFLATSGYVESLGSRALQRFWPADLYGQDGAAGGVLVCRATDTYTGHGGTGKSADLDLRSMIKSLSPLSGGKKKSTRAMSQAPFRRGGRG